MADESAEKKHNATSYRRQKAREQGHFARSEDLTSAAIFLVSVLCLQYFAPRLYVLLQNLFLSQFTFRADSLLDKEFIFDETIRYLGTAMWTVFPLLVSSLTVAVVAHLAQSRFAIPPFKMNFSWERINPAMGLQRLFSLENSSRWGIGVMRVILIAGVLGIATYVKWNQIVVLGELNLAQSAALAWKIILDVLVNMAIVLLVLGICDYGYQLWKFEQQIRMTDDELREELKSTQGDLSAKGRRQKIQSGFGKMMQSDLLPSCDFVIVDPEGVYAIAIHCDPSKVTSPQIVAKGTDAVAKQIYRSADQRSIPVHLSEILAKQLFEQFEEGNAVTSEFFIDMARIFKATRQSESFTDNSTEDRARQPIAA
jgi:flagellar biosynthesis protein FlhB